LTERVFENRVLKGTFEQKRDEVTGGRRKMYNEEVYNLYSSPSTIRKIKLRWMRCVGHIFVGKPEEKRPPGRQRRRWVDNIKMDRREIAWGVMHWINLALIRDPWRALLNTVNKIQDS
jgi:hypothetical protein